MQNKQSATASNEPHLLPCPFCGARPELIVKKEIRTILRCTNPQCYLHFTSPTSWHNGDTEEHAKQRLAAWWNHRPGEAAMKEKYKRMLETAEILDASLREYQQKYGE